jgi:integrase
MATHASPHEGTYWWRTTKAGKKVYAGRAEVNGKAVNASLTLQKGQSEREVERRVKAALREKVARAKAGLDVDAQAARMTLREYGETIWLKDVARTKEASSHLSYSVMWRRHMVGGMKASLKKNAPEEPLFALTRRKLADLRIQHVREWLDELEVRGRKSGTRELVFETLMAVLRQARADYPGQFPNIQVIEDATVRLKPKHDRPRRVFPTPVQVALVFAQLGRFEREDDQAVAWEDLDAPNGAIVHLVYYTAKRISEILGLRWLDWDEINGGVWIRGQQDHRTRKLREYPKHDRHQYLFLPAEAQLVLRAHRQRERLAGKSCLGEDQIFTDRHGEGLDHKRVWRHYKDALEAAELPSFRLHDLRGGWAMAARRGGVDDRTIAEQLGHSNMSTLHAHYFDRTNPLQGAAADIAAKAVREGLSSVPSSVSSDKATDGARSPDRLRVRK